MFVFFFENNVANLFLMVPILGTGMSCTPDASSKVGDVTLVGKGIWGGGQVDTDGRSAAGLLCSMEAGRRVWGGTDGADRVQAGTRCADRVPGKATEGVGGCRDIVDWTLGILLSRALIWLWTNLRPWHKLQLKFTHLVILFHPPKLLFHPPKLLFHPLKLLF